MTIPTSLTAIDAETLLKGRHQPADDDLDPDREAQGGGNGRWGSGRRSVAGC